MPFIDLNCDLGEGCGDDAAVLPFISSANVACGLHAGGPTEMRQTIVAATAAGVAVGAHPGYADRARFGRHAIAMTRDELLDLVTYQLGACRAIAERAGTRVAHVKAHGALYHAIAADPAVAQTFVTAAGDLGDVIVVGQARTPLEAAVRAAGLRFAAEAFADRTYDETGALLPRSHPAALIEADDATVAARAVAMVTQQRVPTRAGGTVPTPVHTLCLHGDDPRAVARAAAIRAALERAEITVAPLASWLPR